MKTMNTPLRLKKSWKSKAFAKEITTHTKRFKSPKF